MHQSLGPRGVLVSLACALLAHVAACDSERSTATAPVATIAAPVDAANARAATTLIANGPVAVNAGSDARVDMPAAFTLGASFSDASATAGPWPYTIDWGDGTLSTGVATSQTSAIAATHSYGAEALYLLSLTVTNPVGAVGSGVSHVTVVDHVAKVSVSAAQLSLDVRGTAQLTATATGKTGKALAGRQFTWTTTKGSVATVSPSGVVKAVGAGDATITASAEAVVGKASVVAYGLPFGPFHLPDDSLKPPFSGVMRAATPATLLISLEAARRAHFRVLLRLSGSSTNYSNPDSTFSLALWKQDIDRYRGIDFSSYIADGTIIGLFLFDEPRDPSNWGGVPVPYADVEAAAAYSKSLWPTMPTGAGSSAADMEPGAPYQSLDFAFTQYREKKGGLHGWLVGQTAAARRAGLGMLLSINVLQGTLANTPYSALRLRKVGRQLAAEPYACGLTMWKYDPVYFRDSTNRAAMTLIAKVANARPPHRCGR